jgi:hypothetical protein
MTLVQDSAADQEQARYRQRRAKVSHNAGRLMTISHTVQDRQEHQRGQHEHPAAPSWRYLLPRIQRHHGPGQRGEEDRRNRGVQSRRSGYRLQQTQGQRHDCRKPNSLVLRRNQQQTDNQVNGCEARDNMRPFQPGCASGHTHHKGSADHRRECEPRGENGVSFH